MDVLLVAGGLAALFLGGETLVRGSVGLALRLRLSPLVIGLTVVGFGTSMPELTVSLEAALRGAAGIALGNVVGSNIANILLILGLAALIRPMPAPGAGLWRDVGAMLAAAAVLVPVFAFGAVDRLAGLLLAAGLALYLAVALRGGTAAAGAVPAGPRLLPALGLVAAGLAALILGARLLVDGAVGIARALAVPEAFIGLTVVAVGTSLPELATSVVAAVRRQAEIAIGNIVGSNIFNVLGILGATALVARVPVEARFLTFDLPVMLAASVWLAAALMWRRRVGRVTGLAMLLAYAGYVAAARG